MTVVGVMADFGFLIALVFGGVTLTVTRQFPGVKATNRSPKTLQIFLEDLETDNAIFDPLRTEIPACLAILSAVVLLLVATRGVLDATAEGAAAPAVTGVLAAGRVVFWLGVVAGDGAAAPSVAGVFAAG